MTHTGASVVRRLEKALKRVLLAILRLLIGSSSSPDIDPVRIKSVLIIRQHNQLGDMLCIVPFLRSLRELLPDGRIVLMASPVNYDVMLHNKYLSDVINYRKEDFLGGRRLHPIRLWRFIRELRGEKFDLAIVPATVSTSFTSDLLAYISGARLRMGAGWLDGVGNPSGFFFNKLVDLDWRRTPERHQTLRNADIASGWLAPPTVLSCEITLTTDEQAWGNSFIRKVKSEPKSLIALHPGAGKPPNRWPAESFARVAEILSSEFDAEVLVTVGPMDGEPLKQFESYMNLPFHLVAGLQIRKVASILAKVNLVISNDTGIMHVAAAVGVPVLSLFGPTDPRQWAPTGEQNRYIQGRDGRIETITVQEVLTEARSMLRRQSLSPRVIAG